MRQHPDTRTVEAALEWLVGEIAESAERANASRERAGDLEDWAPREAIIERDEAERLQRRALVLGEVLQMLHRQRSLAHGETRGRGTRGTLLRLVAPIRSGEGDEPDER